MVIERTGKKNNRLLILFCVILGTLVFVRDVFSISISKYILLGVSAAGMCLLNPSQLMPFLAFNFALTYGIPGTYIYAIAAILLLIRRGSKQHYTVGIWLVFIIAEVILNAVYGETMTFAGFTGYASRLLLLFIFLSEKEPSEDYFSAVKAYAIGTTVFIAIVFILYIQDASITSILSGSVRLGNAKGYWWVRNAKEGLMMATNANNVAYIGCVGMGCCLVSYLKENKLLWVILYIALMIITALTMSKTFFVVVVLQLLLLIIVKKDVSRFSAKGLIIGGIAIIAVVLVLSSDVFTVLLNRFLGGDSDRLYWFKQYMSAFLSRPWCFLFGTGSMNYQSVIGINISCHNGLEQVLVSYGVVGFLLFAGTILRQVIVNLKISNHSLRGKEISIVTILSAFVFTQAIQFLNPVELMLPFAIGALALKENYDK